MRRDTPQVSVPMDPALWCRGGVIRAESRSDGVGWHLSCFAIFWFTSVHDTSRDTLVR